MLEIPEIKEAFFFRAGQVIQVPYGTSHRISHFSKSLECSRYILLQIGKFSIDFDQYDTNAYPKTPRDISGKKLDYYIGENRCNLERIASEFKRYRPSDLSASEHVDVLAAFETICNEGIPTEPTKKLIMDQFKRLACT